MKRINALLVGCCLATSVLGGAGWSGDMYVTDIDIGNGSEGSQAIISVTSPLAECNGGVFRMYVNYAGLTETGFKYNYTQLALAKVTKTPVTIYHYGGPSCNVSNVKWRQ